MPKECRVTCFVSIKRQLKFNTLAGYAIRAGLQPLLAYAPRYPAHCVINATESWRISRRSTKVARFCSARCLMPGVTSRKHRNNHCWHDKPRLGCRRIDAMARVFKPWTPATAELELLHECWLARLPPARIAARLGISEPKLNRFMRRVHSARAMPRPEPAKPRQLRHQASSSDADGLFARM